MCAFFAYIYIYSLDSVTRNRFIYIIGRQSAVYFLFNPHVSDYYKAMFLHDIPTAGLRLRLYFGSMDIVPTTDIILAPGTHTVVSLIRQKYRTVARQSKTLDFESLQKPCKDSHEYMHIISSKLGT